MYDDDSQKSDESNLTSSYEHFRGNSTIYQRSGYALLIFFIVIVFLIIIVGIHDAIFCRKNGNCWSTAFLSALQSP